MERIKEQIENEELDAAREAIEALEAQLSEGSSAKEHEVLKEQITTLKKQYATKLAIKIPSIEESQPKPESDVEVKVASYSSEDKPVLSNMENGTLWEVKCKSVDIINCRGLVMKMIDCQGTAFVRNVKESTIYVKAAHLRLTDCDNLHLHVASSCAGIYLQNCKGIKIQAMPSGEALKVFDFDSPVSSKSYRIIEGA